MKLGTSKSGAVAPALVALAVLAGSAALAATQHPSPVAPPRTCGHAPPDRPVRPSERRGPEDPVERGASTAPIDIEGCGEAHHRRRRRPRARARARPRDPGILDRCGRGPVTHGLPERLEHLRANQAKHEAHENRGKSGEEHGRPSEDPGKSGEDPGKSGEDHGTDPKQQDDGGADPPRRRAAAQGRPRGHRVIRRSRARHPLIGRPVPSACHHRRAVFRPLVVVSLALAAAACTGGVQGEHGGTRDAERHALGERNHHALRRLDRRPRAETGRRHREPGRRAGRRARRTGRCSSGVLARDGTELAAVNASIDCGGGCRGTFRAVLASSGSVPTARGGAGPRGRPRRLGRAPRRGRRAARPRRDGDAAL